MKSSKLVIILLLSIFVMSLQACGDAGGSSDTGGALTMTDPALTSNNDGTYTVKTTVTYAPRVGKSAEGVVVTTTLTDSNGFPVSNKHTFTSGSNSVTLTFIVNQLTGSSNQIYLVSNIDGMSASVIATIPPISPMSANGIDFVAGDAVAPGTTKTTVITGGVGTYSLTSPSTVDGVLTVSLAGSTLSVTYVSALIGDSLTQLTANVTITDQANPVHTLSIPVTYFK